MPPGDEYQRLAAPELGGVVLGAGLSLELGIPLLLVRKKSKEYGTTKQIEGRFEPGERVAIIEDIVTSGGAAIMAAEALREAGLDVRDLYCVVDRRRGRRGGGRRRRAHAPSAVHLVVSSASLRSPETFGFWPRFGTKWCLCVCEDLLRLNGVLRERKGGLL